MCMVLLAVFLQAGCGGGSKTSQESRPTATSPPAQATPAGIDVDKVNRARDAFVAACTQRRKRGGALYAVRRPASTLLAALEANPDGRFRRSPGTPAASMRDRVRAAALIARTRCGGGAAVKLGNRLDRAATSASS